ncbi:MAG: response regulator [Chloroflexi bacterium]|nr:MAG: response regulator [Chloroflexota bacterium]
MHSIRIVLIDDSQAFLDVIQNFLSGLDFCTVVGAFQSGAEALGRMVDLQPDLALVDLVMPRMDGLAVTREVKKAFPETAVIVLTMHDIDEYRQAAHEAGAAGYVVKSEMADSLPSLIMNLAQLAAEELPMPKILIVDDSPTIRKMIKTSLLPLKAEFGEAGAGLEAIEQLALKTYDLMILDLNMPDMHGLEVARFVRGYEAYKTLPILILTTRDDAKAKEAAREIGVNFFMTKPFDPGQLIAKSKELLFS